MDFSLVEQMVNEGVIIRYTPTGVGVMMRHSLPGIFYDEHGHEVGPQVARQARYDTKTLLALKKKREAIQKVTAEIEAQYQVAPIREIIAEKNGFRVVGFGMNRYNIEFGESHDPVNSKGFITDKAMALKTLDAIASEEPEAVE